jgi:hypothetical protein
MTLRIYAHLWPAELEQGRNQLDAAIARLAQQPRMCRTGEAGTIVS